MSATADHLLANHKEAERVAGRIEHHAEPALVTIRRVVRGDSGAGRGCMCYSSFHVVDEDLEVHPPIAIRLP